MSKEINRPQLEKDIEIASLVGIVYGIASIIGSIEWPFLSPEIKEVISKINFSSSDLVWNFITGSFSIWCGLKIRKISGKRLKSLTNLLGLYLLKMGIVIGVFIVLGVVQYIRSVFLLSAIFLIFLGFRAQIKIQRSCEKKEKYLFRLTAWGVLGMAFISFCAVTGFLDHLVSDSLLNAIINEDSEAVMLAVKKGENPNRKIMGRPLLFMGIADGDDFCVKALVNAGADVNATSAWGRTALHEAALHGQVGISEFLLQHGADVNARNHRGETPLFYATGGMLVGPDMTERHEQVAKLLLAHGADPNSKNMIGDSPMNMEASEALKKATLSARRLDFSGAKKSLEEMKEHRNSDS